MSMFLLKGTYYYFYSCLLISMVFFFCISPETKFPERRRRKKKLLERDNFPKDKVSIEKGELHGMGGCTSS